MADRNARRRLTRFLDNPLFAGRFRKLLKRDQKRITGLIESGEGREARSLTTELDEQRRAKVRERSRQRRADSAPSATSQSLLALIRTLKVMGIPDQDSHEPDAIDVLRRDLGLDGAKQLLRMQIESGRAWVRGSIQPGNQRWFTQEEILANLGRRDEMERANRQLMGDEPFDDVDFRKFFWYHAKRS